MKRGLNLSYPLTSAPQHIWGGACAVMGGFSSAVSDGASTGLEGDALGLSVPGAHRR